MPSRVLKNDCEPIMLCWKSSKNAHLRGVNRICDTLLAKPAACGSRCRPRFPRRRATPHRVSAAAFSLTPGLPDRLSLRF